MQEGDGVQSEPGRDPEGRAGRGKLLPAMQTQIQIFLPGSNFPAKQLSQAPNPTCSCKSKWGGVSFSTPFCLPPSL